MVDFSKHHSNKKHRALYQTEESEKGLGANLITRLTHLSEESLEGLNPEQREMVISISAYLRDKHKRPFYLAQGGAGTGKSYSIIRAISDIDPAHIIAAAPSHFAKNVLQDFLGEEYKVTTIAALLGKRVTYNEKGDQVLVRINNLIPPPIDKYQIVILDEGSMIEDSVAEEILNIVKYGDKALIILGDYCQLPPVNQETDSIFFNNISSELTISMRFQGPIERLVNIIRAEIIKIRKGLVPILNILNVATNRVSDIDETGSGYIFLNNSTLLLTAAIKRFKKDRGTNYVRLLAYRNKTIEKLNKHVRVGLYGEDPLQFEIGELLINDGGYTVRMLNGKEKQLITNGEIFKVIYAEPILGPYDIPCMRLFFKDVSFEEPIYTVATSGKERYDKVLRELKQAASASKKWHSVAAFKDSFAYFNYSYATSIHKAQGSSISHVFIMEDDVYAVGPISTKEKLQSIHVAISRASFRAYIYNKAFKVDNSQFDTELLKIDAE